MKIKDLLTFYAFKDCTFIDYKTHETIYDYEKEIEDINEIKINEEVEKIDNQCYYLAFHRWLTVYLVLKEDETNE